MHKSKLSLIDVGTVSSPATDLILNFGVNASDAVSTVTGTIAVGLDQDSTPDVVFDGPNKATVIDGVVVGMSYSTSSGIAGVRQTLTAPLSMALATRSHSVLAR